MVQEVVNYTADEWQEIRKRRLKIINRVFISVGVLFILIIALSYFLTK